jgi:hypothetical protein
MVVAHQCIVVMVIIVVVVALLVGVGPLVIAKVFLLAHPARFVARLVILSFSAGTG